MFLGRASTAEKSPIDRITSKITNMMVSGIHLKADACDRSRTNLSRPVETPMLGEYFRCPFTKLECVLTDDPDPVTDNDLRSHPRVFT